MFFFFKFRVSITAGKITCYEAGEHLTKHLVIVCTVPVGLKTNSYTLGEVTQIEGVWEPNVGGNIRSHVRCSKGENEVQNLLCSNIAELIQLRGEVDGACSTHGRHEKLALSLEQSTL